MLTSRRILAIVLVLVLVTAIVLVTSCGSDKSTTPTPTVYHATKYCEAGGLYGFSFAAHPEFVLTYSLDCYKGSEFDANVSQCTCDSVEVIFIGGDNQFSGATAAAIETAVHDQGKVLVINFWSNRDFSAALPATNGGDASYGAYLEVVDPANPIFAGMPSKFTYSGTPWTREHAVPKTGSTVLMRYDNGDPALIYWKYGNGYVIEWTAELMHVFSFGPGELDLITYRTVMHCLSLIAGP